MPLVRRLMLASLVTAPAVTMLSRIGNSEHETLEGPVADLGSATPPMPGPEPAPAVVPPQAVAPPPAPVAGAPASMAGVPAQPAPALSTPASPIPALPAWQRNAIAQPAKDGRPAVTIIVDDMGWMHPHTERVVALPGPLTLSWFPFAPRLQQQVAAAKARGHEMTLHMPMQAFSNSTAQTGPDPLRIDLPPAVNLARLRTAFDAVPDIVGMNNHMGSVATKNVALMDLVAGETKARTMLFLDSIVVPHSVALARAEAAGVPAAGRDIFIDYKNEPAVIRKQLALIEATARRTGHVIAIGHPRPHTIEALEAWLPTLPGRGFAFWPLSAAVAWRNKIDMHRVA